MSRVYATPEIKAERAFKRAEHLERAMAPRAWNTPGLTLGDLEVIADAWEEAGFLGWADNYRAEARLRRSLSSRRDPPASGVRLKPRGPRIESGYALARRVKGRDRDWEDVVVSESLNRNARFLGFARIDGQEHAVWRVGPMFYAQTAVGPRHPSRFRR